MPITVKLVGGLGNQLFGYFAGNYLAKKLGTIATLDLSQQKYNYHNRSSILDLNLTREGDKLIWSPHREATRKILELFPPYIFNSGHSLQMHLKYFRAEGLGWDPRLDMVKPGSTITGYFQTYKYYQSYIGDSPKNELKPRNPSRWYLEMAKIAEETSPITVHMRRGDYNDHRNSIGVYSPRYFLDGIDYVIESSRNQDSEVWVFSDSIKDVSLELKFSRRKIRLITPPKESSAAESMTLFGMGCSHVISNSTFSFWGALTGRGSTVVAPQKWFRGWDDPVDLIPPSWHRLQGEFED
jgi:hypothetical protein